MPFHRINCNSFSTPIVHQHRKGLIVQLDEAGPSEEVIRTMQGQEDSREDMIISMSMRENIRIEKNQLTENETIAEDLPETGIELNQDTEMGKVLAQLQKIAGDLEKIEKRVGRKNMAEKKGVSKVNVDKLQCIQKSRELNTQKPLQIQIKVQQVVPPTSQVKEKKNAPKKANHLNHHQRREMKKQALIEEELQAISDQISNFLPKENLMLKRTKISYSVSRMKP